MNPTSEMCMSRTGLFIYFVILSRVDKPYMATMVYRGIFLIYAKCNINVITQLARDLTDIYALSLGRCAPSGVMHIYQSNPLRMCYNILIYALQMGLLETYN